MAPDPQAVRDPPTIPDDRNSHIYTLVLRPNNGFQVWWVWVAQGSSGLWVALGFGEWGDGVPPSSLGGRWVGWILQH